jgi:hypothetical protein
MQTAVFVGALRPAENFISPSHAVVCVLMADNSDARLGNGGCSRALQGDEADGGAVWEEAGGRPGKGKK